MAGPAIPLLFLAVAGYMPSAPEVKLPPAQQIAAERAAGFDMKGNDAYDDCGDKIEQIYFSLPDLNGDKVPEMIVRAYSMCWGNGGDSFTVLKKTPAGWQSIGSANGSPGVLTVVHGGWHDVEIGGPGLGKMPVLRWNGKEYAHY